MSLSQPVKRIITCQGSIQLVAALTAMLQHEKARSPNQYKNYLVIYDLAAPRGQDQDFIAFITQMAQRICNWISIIYLTPNTLQEIAQRLDFEPSSKIFRTVHQLIGTSVADEIYLCRNWQFGNTLLLNAFQSAYKICYGDSIGIYFSATSSVVPSVSLKSSSNERSSLSFHSLIRAQVRQFRQQRDQMWIQMHRIFKQCTTLAVIDFDQGYFVLPDIFGEVPPMPTQKLEKAALLELFQKLQGLTDSAYIHNFRATIAHAPVTILLTSNLSEAQRLSRENEIAAYRQLLMTHGILDKSILVIKPHPRDDAQKLIDLKESLSDLFADIILLLNSDLFYLPFEIFFLEAFCATERNLHRYSALNHPLKVFAVSSACLSLKLLFDVPSLIGFGNEITSSLFYPATIAPRLEHEAILTTALKKLDSIAVPESIHFSIQQVL